MNGYDLAYALELGGYDDTTCRVLIEINGMRFPITFIDGEFDNEGNATVVLVHDPRFMPMEGYGSN